MIKNICIFEDRAHSRFLPLCYTRAVYELRCGMNSLMEKIIHNYPDTKINLFSRDYIAKVLAERVAYEVVEKVKDGCLFINGRLLMNSHIPLAGEEEISMKDGAVVFARLEANNASLLTSGLLLEGNVPDSLKKIKTTKSDSTLINYPWDLVNNNPDQLKKDFKAFAKPKIAGVVHEGVYMLEKSNIYIGRDAVVKPGVVLDAEEGPIYISEGATILPNATIEGPVFIGKNSLIKAGAKIYSGSNIGEVCKVGGEVENSIIHSCSNKQHEGFLGHSYVGTWVNLAAATDTSDLKNNYSNVKVHIEGRDVDSGSMFVGIFVSDHSKSSIGSKFYSGTIIGVMCNILGTGIPPKYVPSFVWGESGKMVEYNLEKGIEVAGKVMARRKKTLSANEQELLRTVYNLTAHRRSPFLKEKWR